MPNKKTAAMYTNVPPEVKEKADFLAHNRGYRTLNAVVTAAIEMLYAKVMGPEVGEDPNNLLRHRQPKGLVDEQA